MPAAALILYAAMSVIAFALYAVDKRRAARGAWRISEATLHLVEMLGGWPGAWVGQQVLRHKRHKGSYMLIFWAIAGLHVAAWAWWLGLFR